MQTRGESLTVAIGALVESPSNPRESYDPVALQELADSVAVQGIIEPIVVRPAKGKKGKYEIVCGSRRYRAAKLAKLQELPAISRKLNDREVLEIQVVENQQRADVHPIEEAKGYARLRDDHGLTPKEIGKRISKSESHVYQRIQLDKLQGKCREAFLALTITPGHAVELARLKPKHQDEVWDELFWDVDDAVPSVRGTKRFIAAMQRKLSGATWPLDAQLGDLPACTACPYNSDNDPGSEDKGRCLDNGCYSQKRELAPSFLIAQAEADGKPLAPVSTGYHQDDKVLQGGTWSEARSQDARTKAQREKAGIVRGILVAGPEVGRVLWVKPKPKAKAKADKAKAKGGAVQMKPEPSLAELAQREKDRAARVVTNARKEALAELHVSLYNGEDGKGKAWGKDMPAKLVRFLADSLVRTAFHMNDYDSFAVRNALIPEGKKKGDKGVDTRQLVEKYLDTLDPQQLIGFAVESQVMRLTSANDAVENAYRGPDRLAAVCKLVGVDLPGIVKAHQREAKAKADSRAARSADKAKAEAERSAKRAAAASGKAAGKAKAKPKADKPKAKATKAAKPKAKTAAKATKAAFTEAVAKAGKAMGFDAKDDGDGMVVLTPRRKAKGTG